MNAELLEILKKITPEEQDILQGGANIDRNIFDADRDLIDCKKILEMGNLIQVRIHTRFIDYPAHRHNYIEMVYMYSGKTVHIINGTKVELNTGEILILNPNSIQEIRAAGVDDIAVNFIILPEFFDTVLHLLGEENNIIWSFLTNCMKGEKDDSAYLLFHVSDVLTVQNLTENLVSNLVHKVSNRRSINQITMGLLFATLMNHTERIQPESIEQQELIFKILRYIDEHYWNGSLEDLSLTLNYDISWLSRLIKKEIGKNFTELIQEKRMNQAAFLLNTTGRPVAEIGEKVGYSNMSYFHRIFKEKFGCSPKEFRKRTRNRM